LFIGELEAHPADLVPARTAIQGDRRCCGHGVDNVQVRRVPTIVGGTMCMVKKCATNAAASRSRIDEQASDVQGG
jgi:hypothetical protein